MLEFSSALSTMLGNATSKAVWSASFILALGDSRRLICTKDGVPFINVALTGAITTAGGNITGFGKASDATVRQAADLSTDVCLLRIEGNGNYVQGTLGLAGSGADFILSSNPTGTSGIGFASAAKILAPTHLPSGTGPAAPELDANSITAFRVWDYTDEANPVVAGIGTLNVRDPDMVMEHPWMAQDYGDVRQMRMADGTGVVLGTGGDCFRIAGTLLVMHAGANSEANVPLQQLEIRSKPHGRHASFPFQKDLDLTTDTFILPAHKIDILRGTPGNYTVVDVIEMYSTRVNNVPGTGKPVNFAGQTLNKNVGPSQPFFTCNMLHQWWSHRPKLLTYADHLNPSVEPEALGPTNVTGFASSLDNYPPITEGQNFNGLVTWSLAPKWSRKADTGFDTNIINPYWIPAEMIRNGYMTQVIGYGHEPGSTCTQIQYMALGGSRACRACRPTAHTTFFSDKNGVRPHGAVPYRELFHHFNMGFFNRGDHFFVDLERGIGIPKSKVLNGEIANPDNYYAGGSSDYRPDMPNNGIRLLATPRAGSVGPLDKNGRRFTNDYARDAHHNQPTAAAGAYTYISPAHVRAARHSFTAAVAAAFDLTQGFDKVFFLTRQHAWLNWQFVNAWIVATSDPSGFTMNDMEGMWGRHFEATYDSVWPEWNANTTVYGKTLRTMGMPMLDIVNFETGMTTLEPLTDSKANYWGQVLLLMKQSGAWAKMRARSTKCAAILDLIVESLNKFNTGVLIDANGRTDKVFPGYHYANTQTPPLPTNWGVFTPPDGQADWIRLPNGAIGDFNNAVDGTNTMHFRAQTQRIFRDYFPEYNLPRRDQAIAVADAFYATVAAGVAAGTGNQFGYRFSMMGLFNPPDYVGPPV